MAVLAAQFLRLDCRRRQTALKGFLRSENRKKYFKLVQQNKGAYRQQPVQSAPWCSAYAPRR